MLIHNYGEKKRGGGDRVMHGGGADRVMREKVLIVHEKVLIV